MTEHDVQSLIAVELSRRGCIVNRTNSGVFYVVPSWAFNSNKTVTLGEWLRQNVRRVTIGHRGQSDLQGHRPDGRCFYIEVKRPGQKPRQNQQDFLEAMRNTGALAGVAHSVEEAVGIVFGGKQQ